MIEFAVKNIVIGSVIIVLSLYTMITKNWRLMPVVAALATLLAILGLYIF